MSSITISIYFVRLLIQGILLKGYSEKEVLESCDLSVDILYDDHRRITLEQFGALSAYIMKELEDEAFGLLEKPIRRNAFRLLAHSCVHTDTIGESMRIMADFFNLLENGYHHEIEIQSDLAIYKLTPLPSAKIVNHLIRDSIFLIFQRLHSWLSDRRLNIVYVTIDREENKAHKEYGAAYSGAKLKFDDPIARLAFHKSILELPVLRDKHALLQLLKIVATQTPAEIITRTLQPDSLSSRIRNFIELHLEGNQKVPDLDLVEAHVGMSSQSIRRHLLKTDTSFQQIKTQVRRDIAISMLNEKGLSVEEISLRLGFSEPGSFIRAFKSWTGKTPTAYRSSID